jgi:hypothetical protein
MLVFFGTMALIDRFTNLSAWGWIAGLFLVGLGIFGVYLTDRSDWGLLIPTYVMWVIAAMVALITLDVLRDEAIATYVLWAIALPFLVVYLRNREQWWALIPAYVLLAVGLMVALIGVGVLDDLLIPSYVMFAIAVPFFVVYTRNTKNWWALIPGGIMAVIGISFLIAEAQFQYIVAIVLIVGGVWILARQFIRRGSTGPAEEAPTAVEAEEPPAE